MSISASASASGDFDTRSFTDRYFSRRYCLDVKNAARNDHMLLFHSNRICVVALAPSHPVFSLDESFRVDFHTDRADRTKNAVKGKGKRGGQTLEENSVLCKIVTASGREFKVSSCIDGKLIEINEALSSDPALLRDYPDSNGYVAVVLARIAESDAKKNQLLTPEQYSEALKRRGDDT